MANSQQYSQTILDASNESSRWEATIPQVTALSLPGILTALTALETAIAPIIRGTIIRKQADVYDNTFARVIPTDEEASRETKWLVIYHDNTTEKTFRSAIPTCKKTGHMQTGTDNADLSPGSEMKAFADAFVSAFRSPDDPYSYNHGGSDRLCWAQPVNVPYITDDVLPDDYICRVIRIPNSLLWVAAVNGALYDLAEVHSWEAVGAVTAQQAADRFWLVWDEYQQSVCTPIGAILPFAGDAVPAHFLMCDGSSYAAADYPALFGVVGYIYGGSGANFNVPDLRGRTVLGVGTGPSLSTYLLGDVGGSESHQLTVPEMPAHSHTNPPHTHTYSSAENVEPVLAPGEAPTAIGIPNFVGASSITVDNTGGDGAHENRQPFMALNYIIQAV